MLVARHDERLALLLRDRHRRDLLRERAVGLRARRLLLAAQRERVLIGAAHAVIGRDIFGRLRHRIDAVPLFHQRIDEAPADGRIEDLGLARERARRLAGHERRAAHALDAAGDHQARLARLDRARGEADRVHPGAAEAVDRRAGHGVRQAGEQQRHARDVAVVLAGLIRAAVDHVVDGGPVDVAVALDERLERHRAEVVGPHRRQRAAVAADGRADCVTQECFGHVVSGRSDGASRLDMPPLPLASNAYGKCSLYEHKIVNRTLPCDHRQRAAARQAPGPCGARVGATRPHALIFSAAHHFHPP
ncbi:Uncharacterised protein [Burkholderia pseudomallei]|nr:Uncharacterised protein [Burkholderia pseudomallei]CAJ7002811.1 Uncharacterised protein [Burkholderia pseudomallei]CAJ7403148.1 Uncharacterised protein [Burkholderia pseudomallei]CAJ7733582.1 Uncharacterised protein [Burkholderia pseudomallei]CAJ8597144.1 Uncharacterised protein [Burkholderia pseudomallei]